MSETVLIITVGGSHQPILTAIRERQPAFVLFFCTDKDEATGRPGSITTIKGQGQPIEVRRGETIERHANIPTQAGLTVDSFDVCIVPPDDLDRTVAIMLNAVSALRQRFPNARLVADYTGGTKSMTAALVLAAVESEAVALQVVTGPRADLVKVYDGRQSGLDVSDEGIRARRSMAPYLAAWQRFAYGESANGLRRIAMPGSSSLRAELQIARDLSGAFDAWDRFDHRAALDQLEMYRPRIGATAAPWFTALKSLNAVPEEPRRTPARLWDLWLNAQRRAAQGRFDDAVARGYRLLEWTAQWLLSTVGVVTADLREEQIPGALPIQPNADGKRQAGLRNAWELAAHHLGGDVAQFVECERGHMLDQLRKRNFSILAHGETPITRADWETFSDWMEKALIPLLRDQAARVGLKSLAPQLPQQPPWQSPAQN
jgi:CRISPR-associated protein (TIGR02710 family)